MNKDTMKITVTALCVIVVLSGIGTLVWLTQNNWVVTTITTLTTIAGVFAVWLQMRKGKQISEGEFILSLRREFVSNPNIFHLTVKLEKYDRSDKGKNPFNEDDISNVAAYMTFFEIIYLLIKRNILKLFMVDLLFSFHFFLLINNPRIQELELLPCQDYYLDVYRLYYEWITYRQKKSLPVYGYESNILDVVDKNILNQVHKKEK